MAFKTGAAIALIALVCLSAAPMTSAFELTDFISSHGWTFTPAAAPAPESTGPLVTKTTPLITIPPATAGPSFGKKTLPPIVAPKKSFELPGSVPPLVISEAGVGKHG
ncbi:hypothetical protein QBZ16_003720 [Prototheca wickerhamii]|uniref:Uncharacterized protein n=1 Tax=Prototheca wickerhamii TaxID=3111 RepID=A0AAD9MI55_PROWI|nr:hypothetical protein QBZ16_003720 [Prototheca wickerhamii]